MNEKIYPNVLLKYLIDRNIPKTNYVVYHHQECQDDEKLNIIENDKEIKMIKKRRVKQRPHSVKNIISRAILHKKIKEALSK